MGRLEVGSIDGAEVLADGGPDMTLIHQAGDLLEQPVLGVHVLGLVHGTGEHELDVQRQALGFELHHIQSFRIVDHGDPTERRQQFDVAVEVGIGGVQTGNMGHLANAVLLDQGGDLWFQRLGVIDHEVRPQLLDPSTRRFPGGRGDEGGAGQRLGQLQQDGAHTAGERYLPQCEQALGMLEQARRNIRDDSAAVEGEIRLSVSSDLGRNIVMPWLDEFMAEHPQIRLRVNISDSNIDFYRDTVDMALRYGAPSDANLYGFKICNVPGLLCATREYLQRQGNPVHPQDLAGHNGLFYQLHDILHDVWTFSRDGKQYKIKMRGNRASNDGDLVRRWCVSGKGIAVKSCLDMSDDLLAGRVVSVMSGYRPRTSELWLICPSRQSITPAMRLLRDRLQEKCTRILEALIERGILDQYVLG